MLGRVLGDWGASLSLLFTPPSVFSACSVVQSLSSEELEHRGRGGALAWGIALSLAALCSAFSVLKLFLRSPWFKSSSLCS